MANPCAGLDPTWAHLPAPAAGHCHPWLFPTAAFENEALTCALRASMTPTTTTNTNAHSLSYSYPTTPSSSSTSSASDLLSGGGGHDAPPAASRPTTFTVLPPARAGLMGPGPKAGRVTKRKPRPSRRPPVTYIAADPANFRRMVQEVTGCFPVASSGVRMRETASAAAANWPAAPTACALPTLDTSAFLLDRAVAEPAPARGREEGSRSSSGAVSPAMAVTVAAAVEDDDSSVVMKELEAMACATAFLSDDFPTLESWGII